MVDEELFMNSVWNRDLPAAQRLIDAGADVNTATSDGCTALMLAVMPDEFGDHFSANAMLDMAKLLIANGARTDLRDNYDRTASDYAKQHLDPAWRDKFGDNAVDIWTKDLKSLELIKLLISLLGETEISRK